MVATTHKRWIARCRGCKAVMSTLAAVTVRGELGALVQARGSYYLPCPKCSGLREAAPVKGRYSAAHECGGVCQNASGGSCDCKCAGLNHGAAYG